MKHSSNQSTLQQIEVFVSERIAFLGTAAVLVASFAMTAIASGRAPRHRRHDVLVAHSASDQPDQVIQWNQLGREGEGDNPGVIVALHKSGSRFIYYG